MKTFKRAIFFLLVLFCFGLTACGGRHTYKSIYTYSFFGHNKLEIALPVKDAYQDPVASHFNRPESLDDFSRIITNMRDTNTDYRCSLYGIEDKEYPNKFLFIEKLEKGQDYYYLLFNHFYETGKNNKYLLFNMSGRLRNDKHSIYMIFPYHLIPISLWNGEYWAFEFGTDENYPFRGDFTALKDFYVNCGGYDVTDYGATLELAEKSPDADKVNTRITVIYDETERSVRFGLKTV